MGAMARSTAAAAKLGESAVALRLRISAARERS